SIILPSPTPPPLALHSFPTRRSSDLHLREGALELPRPGLARRRHLALLPRRLHARPARPPVHRLARAANGGDAARVPRRLPARRSEERRVGKQARSLCVAARHTDGGR